VVDPSHEHAPAGDVSAPVRRIPGDPQVDAPEAGIALCLSGGGYRAMLFHVGALRRLNELGYLSKLERVSSVSGGSFTAGILAAHWSKLDFDDAGIARGFDASVLETVRAAAGRTIDLWAIVRGIFLPGSIGTHYARLLERHVLGARTLQDLPDRPRFVINATNLQSAVLWRFSKPYMRDYRVGEVKRPTVSLATAVAASGAFPPLLSPVELKLEDASYTPGSGLDLQLAPYTTNVRLTDGGVYDNLGLETAWKRYRTILVSNGGGHIAGKPKPDRDWLRQPLRVLGVIDSQVRALRAQQAIDGFRRRQREGAYWGIRTDIADFGLADALPCPHAATLALAGLPTRLKKTNALTQERLINWGYAVCDAAIRRYVNTGQPPPSDFPYPSAGVG